MGGLTCHHKRKRETFLHCLSVNLVGQCGKTHIVLVWILQKENTNITSLYVHIEYFMLQNETEKSLELMLNTDIFRHLTKNQFKNP